MNRGAITVGVAAVMIIGAIIGMVILDGVASTGHTGTGVVNESLGTVTNGSTDTIANRCLAAAPTSVYDWTNGTEIAASNYTASPGTYPNRASNTITWAAANFAHNNSVVGVNYSYGCNIGSTPLLQTIYEFFPVVAALLVLAMAGGWVYLKGGL